MRTKGARAMKELRDRRRKLGLCQRCGGNLEVGSTFANCQSCREYIKDFNLEHYPPKELSTYDWSFLHFRRITNDMVPETSFGRCLQRLMLDQIVCPVYLAEYLGVSTRTIGRWINEGAIPAKHRWGSLRQLFNCSLDDLGLE